MDDFTQFTSGSLATFSNQKQAEYGADQMVLLAGERTDYGGLGEMPGHRCVVMFPANGFPTDANGNVVYVNGVPQQGPVMPPYTVTIHELGHGFGCHHDRKTEKAMDGDGHYYYGYVFNDASDTRFPPCPSGTIMSYTAPICPNFSNPNVTYHEYPTGVAAGQPTAVYNAKVITDAAPAMVATMNPAGFPVIVQQPQSVTVTSGSSFSLSLSASGSGRLSYQWYKGGQSLAGSTASTSSVSTAVSSDAGQYTVVVSNAIGSVTSSAATVMVGTSAANPSSPGGGTPVSGGDGGGGGAPSLWFYGALALLAVVRRFPGCRAAPIS